MNSEQSGAQVGVPAPPAEMPAVDEMDRRIKSAHCDGLTSAMTIVWEERGRHLVLSEAFFALTKVWEALYAQRCREETKVKQ